MADAPYVTNGDVYGLYLRLDRYLTELYKCASNSVPYVSVADQQRIMSYFDAADRYVDWMQREPELDLPETSPKPYALPARCAWTRVESDDLNDLLRLMDDTMTELVGSQSARMPCRLISYDQVRFTAYIAKMRDFMLGYIQQIQPLDFPESSPRDIQSGPGKGGV